MSGVRRVGVLLALLLVAGSRRTVDHAVIAPIIFAAFVPQL